MKWDQNSKFCNHCLEELAFTSTKAEWCGKKPTKMLKHTFHALILSLAIYVEAVSCAALPLPLT